MQLQMKFVFSLSLFLTHIHRVGAEKLAAWATSKIWPNIRFLLRRAKNFSTPHTQCVLKNNKNEIIIIIINLLLLQLEILVSFNILASEFSALAPVYKGKKLIDKDRLNETKGHVLFNPNLLDAQGCVAGGIFIVKYSITASPHFW